MENMLDCCYLCLDNVGYDNLINRDGMIMCQKCYDKYSENSYNEKGMLVNAIKKYRNRLGGL